MIRRRISDDFLLITQNDHAAFSGFLASHIGTDKFDLLASEVIAAIAAHDAGWPLHDDDPTLNKDGLPLHVFEIPISLATQIWSASAERAATLGPYAALLVSLHQLALSDIARQHSAAAFDERAAVPRDLFNLNKFQHAQIERQELLRRELRMRTDIPLHLGLAEPGAGADEDLLRFNFRMLTFCDRISLEICCGGLLFPSIQDVHPRAGASGMSIQTWYGGDGSLIVDPWPFNRDPIEVDIQSRRISSAPFNSERKFREAYHASAVQPFRIVLRRNLTSD